MRLVLAGFGIVGQSFARLLMVEEKELVSTYGVVPQVVGIMDSSGWLVDEHGIDLKKALRMKKETGKVVSSKRRKEELPKGHEDPIRDLEAEVLIEATPTNFKTGEPGFSHMKAAFESRKNVITCNKGPLAIAYYALHELARHNGVQLRFSGAVGGGTPVLDFGKTCSIGDQLIGIRGILNGTCNYILTRMEQQGASFDEALEGAQKAGYAEANPSLDIDGYDSAVKLVITANHLLLSKAGIKDVRVSGIRGIASEDVLKSKKEGRAIRLIASVSQERGLVVEPTVIEREHPLCINGANNAVEFECEYSGPKVIIGKGAGGPETASSLLRDLLEIREKINGPASALSAYRMSGVGASAGGRVELMKIVMKFGGSSVASAERIKNVADRVKGNGQGHQVVVVCSAMGNVTDELLALCADASKGLEKPVEERLASIREMHLAALTATVSDKSVRRQVSAVLNVTLSQLEKLARGSTVLGELTPRSKDAIVSCGERLSNPIVWGALLEREMDSVYMTGGECGIMTDDRFGDASPLMEVTKFQVREKLAPLLAEGKTPVITGYIGATQSGDTTTLGRGGSDLTGTVIAAAIEADEAWIWSDVDGLMTADPRLVTNARVLREISYEEAGEMAVFGAKALHPRTLEPVAEKGIPVRFRNTFKPEDEGTVVKRNPKLYSRHTVKAVALVKEVAVITIASASMVGKPGSAARIFEVMGRSGINVLMISQSVSESNISMVVARASMEKGANALELALLGQGGYRHVLTENDVSAIAIVGGDMRATRGVASTAFGAISAKGINIKMIASGSSNQNISLVVAEKDAKETVRAVHSAFHLDRLNSHAA